MNRSDENTNLQLGAANITLLILRSAASSAAVLPSGILLNGQELPKREVLATLAAFPKPVVCTAEVAEGVLSISCRPPSMSELEEHTASAHLPGLLFLEHRASLARSKRPVVMVGREHEALISIAAIDLWSNDYMIGIPYGVLSRRASWRERLQGVGLVMTTIRGGQHQVVASP